MDSKWSVIESTPDLVASATLGHAKRYQPDWFREAMPTLQPILNDRNAAYNSWVYHGQQRDTPSYCEFKAARARARGAVDSARIEWIRAKAQEATESHFNGAMVWKCIHDLKAVDQGLWPVLAPPLSMQAGIFASLLRSRANAERMSQKYNSARRKKAMSFKVTVSGFPGSTGEAWMHLKGFLAQWWRFPIAYRIKTCAGVLQTYHRADDHELFAEELCVTVLDWHACPKVSLRERHVGFLIAGNHQLHGGQQCHASASQRAGGTIIRNYVVAFLPVSRRAYRLATKTPPHVPPRRTIIKSHMKVQGCG